MIVGRRRRRHHRIYGHLLGCTMCTAHTTTRRVQRNTRPPTLAIEQYAVEHALAVCAQDTDARTAAAVFTFVPEKEHQFQSPNHSSTTRPHNSPLAQHTVLIVHDVLESIKAKEEDLLALAQPIRQIVAEQHPVVGNCKV
jgi:hypothetical protein